MPSAICTRKMLDGVTMELITRFGYIITSLSGRLLWPLPLNAHSPQLEAIYRELSSRGCVLGDRTRSPPSGHQGLLQRPPHDMDRKVPIRDIWLLCSKGNFNRYRLVVSMLNICAQVSMAPLILMKTKVSQSLHHFLDFGIFLRAMASNSGLETTQRLLWRSISSLSVLKE